MQALHAGIGFLGSIARDRYKRVCHGVIDCGVAARKEGAWLFVISMVVLAADARSALIG